MNRVFVAVLSLALINLAVPTSGSAADTCPPELAQAKAALKTAQAAVKKPTPVAKGQQGAPQALAGSRSQDVQAPRSQDVQAPRSQDVQAPRSQDVQAPRSQDVQAPRSQDVQAPRISKARALIRDSEAACKKGDLTLSAQKAKDALAALK